MVSLGLQAYVRNRALAATAADTSVPARAPLAEGALDEEEQVEELQRQQGPPPAEAVELGGPLGALVHELMQPGDLSTFLARHEVARRTATAENSRPASRGTRMLAAAERQLAAAARRGDRSAVL